MAKGGGYGGAPKRPRVVGSYQARALGLSGEDQKPWATVLSHPELGEQYMAKGGDWMKRDEFEDRGVRPVPGYLSGQVSREKAQHIKKRK